MAPRDTQVRPSKPTRGPTAAAVAPVVGRYSVQKFLDLHEYTKRSSHWRVLWVHVTIPIPGLIAALLPGLLPLEPLHRGATTAFLAHVFFIMVFISWGSIIPVLAITQTPPSIYSHREAVAITILRGAIHTAFVSQMTASWRFPVPMMWVVGATVWSFSLALAHLIVLRSKCWREAQLLESLKKTQAALSLEMMQVVLYPAISILFDRVDQTYQVLITLAFPLVKVVLKKAIQMHARHIEDQHGLVVVSAVEICSSLYQSIIMQSAPSKVAMAIIMGIDFIQGLVAIHYFLDRPPHGLSSRHELVPKALEMLHVRHIPTLLTVTPRSATSVAPATESSWKTIPAPGPLQVPPPKLSVSDSAIVQEALQLVYAAETIVLLEYYEVIVPLLNCVFIVVAAQFQAALYNTKLRGFYLDSDKLSCAVASIMLYSLLQGLSCVVMHLVMKYRYGVSASYLLAFVLERHKRAIQAKMIAWLPIILHFSTVHYGTDFSFKFAFKTWEQW